MSCLAEGVSLLAELADLLVVVEVSADSHPFWTGSRRIVDAAGQVEKFNRRYGNRRSGAHGR